MRAISFVATYLVLSATVLGVWPEPVQAAQHKRAMMGMMGGGCHMMGMMGHGKMRRGRMAHHGGMEAMVEGRLAYLKSALNISADQKEAWGKYAEAVRERMETVRSMRQGMMETMQSGTAIERMDARISGMEAMLEAMKAVKPATEALYAALSDEQKKTADELIGRDCGAM